MALGPHVFGYLFELVDQENAFATFATVWLTNEYELGMIFHVRFKFIGLLRQQEADGREIELLLKRAPHSARDTEKHFLPGQKLNHWVPIPVELVLGHLLEVLDVQGQGKPVQVASHRGLFEVVSVYYVLQGLELAPAVACVYHEDVGAVVWFLSFTQSLPMEFALTFLFLIRLDILLFL